MNENDPDLLNVKATYFTIRVPICGIKILLGGVLIMKTSSIKKLMAVAMATVMVAGLAVTGFATETKEEVKPSPSPVATATPAAEVVAPAAAPAVVATEASAPVVEVKETSAAGGSVSTVGGSYAITGASGVTGVAITTPVADIKQTFAMAGNETPFVQVYSFDAKQAPAANAALNALAATQNANVVGNLNVVLAKKSGKTVTMLDGTQAVVMKVAIQKNKLKAGATYAVIAVHPGGKFEIIPAVVDANGVVTFACPGGQGAYAVIAY